MSLLNFIQNAELSVEELKNVAAKITSDPERVEGYTTNNKSALERALAEFSWRERDGALKVVTTIVEQRRDVCPWQDDVLVAIAHNAFYRSLNTQSFIKEVMASKLGSGVLDLYTRQLQTNQCNDRNRRMRVLRDLLNRYGARNFYRFTMHHVMQKGGPESYRTFWLQHGK